MKLIIWRKGTVMGIKSKILLLLKKQKEICLEERKDFMKNILEFPGLRNCLLLDSFYYFIFGKIIFQEIGNEDQSRRIRTELEGYKNKVEVTKDRKVRGQLDCYIAENMKFLQLHIKVQMDEKRFENINLSFEKHFTNFGQNKVRSKNNTLGSFLL